MDNVIITDNVFATLAGPTLPMGHYVLNVNKASSWTPVVTVKVKFSISFFLSFFPF